MAEGTKTEVQHERAAESAGEGTEEHAAARARQRTTEVIEEQRNALAEEVLGIARALQTTGETLRQQGQTPAARYASRAAAATEDLGHSLGRKSLSEMMNDMEELSRRQPGLMAGGAVLAGFIAARWVRGTSRKQKQSGDGGVAE